jgi:hypothetical protein
VLVGSTDQDLRIGRQLPAPVSLEALLASGAQVIDMNPVFAPFENPFHSLQQSGQLFFAEAALEDAALHARAVIFHHPSNAIEPFMIGDVIGNEQKHKLNLESEDKMMNDE